MQSRTIDQIKGRFYGVFPIFLGLVLYPKRVPTRGKRIGQDRKRITADRPGTLIDSGFWEVIKGDGLIKKWVLKLQWHRLKNGFTPHNKRIIGTVNDVTVLQVYHFPDSLDCWQYRQHRQLSFPGRQGLILSRSLLFVRSSDCYCR